MVKIKPYEHPQVLLLGNGLNRTYGGTSWTDLMRKIAIRDDLPGKLTCPYPLQAILVTNDNVKKAMKEYKDAFFGKVNDELRSYLQTLLSIGFDDILTTNYSYELETAAGSSETVNESFLKKTCRNIEDGERAELKYMLRTFQNISFENHDNRVWHIHGEARKANSIILGHYYYATLLYRMIDFVRQREKSYRVNQAENTMQTIKGWIDSFILGDVYILGFGMDFSEFDMWWLLNRKKQEKAKHGRVYFYSPGDDAFEEKQELLKLLDVEVIHCGITKPIGSDEEKNAQFREFYSRAIKDISQKIRRANNVYEEN